MKTFGPNGLIYGIIRYFFCFWGAIKKITATPENSWTMEFGNIWTPCKWRPM